MQANAATHKLQEEVIFEGNTDENNEMRWGGAWAEKNRDINVKRKILHSFYCVFIFFCAENTLGLEDLFF